jgi:hypothetical protein
MQIGADPASKSLPSTKVSLRSIQSQSALRSQKSMSIINKLLRSNMACERMSSAHLAINPPLHPQMLMVCPTECPPSSSSAPAQ